MCRKCALRNATEQLHIREESFLSGQGLSISVGKPALASFRYVLLVNVLCKFLGLYFH